MPYSIPEFANAVRSKYPEYADWDDRELVDSITKKYPEYRDWVQVATGEESPGLEPIGQQPIGPQPTGPQPMGPQPEYAVSRVGDQPPETPGENIVEGVLQEGKDEPAEAKLSRLKAQSQKIGRLLSTGLSRFTEPGETPEDVRRMSDSERRALMVRKGIIDRRIASLEEGQAYVSGERFADRAVEFAPIGVRPPEEEQYRDAPESFDVSTVEFDAPAEVKGEAPTGLQRKIPETVEKVAGNVPVVGPAIRAAGGVEGIKRAGEKVAGLLGRFVASKFDEYGDVNNPLVPETEMSKEAKDEYAQKLERGKAVLDRVEINPEFFGTTPAISQEDAEKIGSKEDVEAAWLYLQAQQVKKKSEQSEAADATARKIYDVSEKIDPSWLRLEEIREQIAKIEDMSPGIASAFRSGAASTAIDMASAMAMYSDDPELIKQLGGLSDELANVTSAEEYSSIINRTAQMLPAMLTGMAVSAVPYIGTALSTSYWATQGAGSMYREMVMAGIDPEIAKKIAVPSGVVYGAIENLQVGKIMGKNQLGILKAIASKKLKKLAQSGKKFTTDVLKETWEEVLQNFVEQTTLPVAQIAEGEDVDPLEYLKNIAATSIETAVTSFPSLALVSAPGAAIGGAARVRAERAAKKEQAVGEAISEVSRQEREKKAEERRAQGTRLEDYGYTPEQFKALPEEEQDLILPRLSQEEQNSVLGGVSRETQKTPTPEGAMPEGVTPEGAMPEGVTPEGVTPEGAIPKTLPESSATRYEGEGDETSLSAEELAAEEEKRQRFRNAKTTEEKDIIWDQMDPITQMQVEEEEGYQPKGYANIVFDEASVEDQADAFLEGRAPESNTKEKVSLETLANVVISRAKEKGITIPKEVGVYIVDAVARHPVTNLPSNAHLQSRKKKAIPEGHTRFVLEMDMDNFNAFNGVDPRSTPIGIGGHGFGDYVMGKAQKKASKAVADAGGDFFHIGGDESFAVFDLPDENAAEIIDIAKRVKDAVNRVEVEINGKRLSIGYTVGIGRTTELADAALTETKKKGNKNGIGIDSALKKRYNISEVAGVDYTSDYLDAGLRVREKSGKPENQEEAGNVEERAAGGGMDRRETDSGGRGPSGDSGDSGSQEKPAGVPPERGGVVSPKDTRSRLEEVAGKRPYRPDEQQQIIDLVGTEEMREGGGSAKVAVRPAGTDYVASEEIARALGKQIVWYTGGTGEFKGKEGITPSFANVIIINDDVSDPVMSVFAHEATHRLRRDHRERWNELGRAIYEALEEKGFEQYKADYLKRFGEKAYNEIAKTENPDLIFFDELMAEVVADLSTEKGFWRRVAEKAPDAVRKLIEVMDDLIKSVRKTKYRASKLIKPGKLEAVRDAAAEALASMERSKGKKKKGAEYKRAEVVKDGGVVSLESVPSTSTEFSPWVHNASQKVKMEYQREMLAPLYREDGKNKIYSSAGLYEVGWGDVSGAWEGASNPVRQTFFEKPDGASVDDMLWRMDMSAAALGYLYKQDAVAHHYANFKSGKMSDQNGVQVEIGRDITSEEAVELQAELDAKAGKYIPALVSIPGGYRILHFDGANVPFYRTVVPIVGNKEYTPTVTRFSFVGGMPENNWKENKDGQDYRRWYSGTRQPDLPDGTDHVAYKEVAREVREETGRLKDEIERVREGLDDIYGAVFKRREGSGARPEGDGGRDRGRGGNQGFFAAVTEGRAGGSDVPYSPTLDLSGHRRFVDEYNKHRAKFDDHIAKSIPAFADVQPIVGDAIIKSYPEGASMVDIGASEGSFIKAITSLSDGKIKTLGVDPSPEMVSTFRRVSEVEGADYEVAAFNSDGWTEPDGTEIPGWDSDKKYDIAHEAMTFQFISARREAQIAAMKDVLKPSGIAIVEEKFFDRSKQWEENEEKKYEYKTKYFSPDDLRNKDESVLVGMHKNMVPSEKLEGILSDNFAYVSQFWDSGNFKGYVASDSLEAVDRFLGNLSETDSEYSTVETPRWITEITDADRENPLVAFKRTERAPSPAGKAKRISVKPFDMVGAKYNVEELQDHINKARGKLRRIKNQQTLLMRAQATLTLDEFNDYERRISELGDLEVDQKREVEDVRREMRDRIKAIVQAYAKQVRYGGDVSRMIDRAKTPKSMMSVIDDIDSRVEKNAQRTLVKVLSRRMDRLEKMIERAEKGNVSGTLTPETAKALRDYFKWVRGDTPRPNIAEIEEKVASGEVLTAEESALKSIDDKITRGDALTEEEKAFVVRCNMPTMEEMSSDQLVDTIRDIDHVYKTGRTIRQAQIEKAARKLEVRKGAVLKQIQETTNARQVELAKKRITEATAASSDSDILGIGKSYGWAYLRPELVQEWFTGHYQMMGMRPGAVTRYVYEPMREASMVESQALAEHKQKIGELFERVDLSSIYQKTIPVNVIDVETGEQYSDNIDLNQAMAIYAHSQNEDNRRHLYGSGFTDEAIYSVSEALPVEVKEAVDDLISWYDDHMYPRLNGVFQRVYGVDMPKSHRYFPIMRLDRVNADSGVMRDLIQRYSTRPVGVSKGRTKKRVKSAAAFKDLDFFGTVFSAMRQNEHYIAFEGAASQARRFLTDPQIKKAMKAKSESAYNTVWRWYQDTAAGRAAQNMTALDKFAEYLRKGYGVFALGFNPRVMAKQVASMPLGITFSNPGMVGQYTLQYLTNPRALERQVQSMSPYMAQRSTSQQKYIQELAEAKEMQRLLRIGGKMAKVREVSMAGIQQFDRTTTTILWMSKFNDSLAKHGSRERAIKDADMLIRRTQPEAGMVNLPEAFRDRGVVGSMVVFTNQINQNMNTLAMIGMAGKRVPKSKQFAVATGTFFSLLAASGFLYLVDNAFNVRRFVDDPEGSLIYLLNGIFGTFPFVGDAVDYLGREARNVLREKRGQKRIHVWEYDPSPTLVGFAQTAVEAGSGAIEALGAETTQERMRAIAKATEAGAETVAAITGQPASMPIRAYKGAMRVKDEGVMAVFYPKSSLQDLSLQKAMSERINRPSGWEGRIVFLNWWDQLPIQDKKAFVERYEIKDPLEKIGRMRKYLNGEMRDEVGDIDAGKVKFGYSPVKKGGMKNYFAKKRERAFMDMPPEERRNWARSPEIEKINAEEKRFLRERKKYIENALAARKEKR